MRKVMPEYRRRAAGGDPPAPTTVLLLSRVRLRGLAWRSPLTESRPHKQALIWSSCISLSFALRICAFDNQTLARLRIFPIADGARSNPAHDAPVLRAAAVQRNV